MAENISELLAEIQDLTSKIEAIAFGNQDGLISHKGKNRKTLTAEVNSQFSPIRALADYRITFETKADLVAYGAPTVNTDGTFPLATVWNSSNPFNGLYGWNGAEWVKSPYDQEEYLNYQLAAKTEPNLISFKGKPIIRDYYGVYGPPSYYLPLSIYISGVSGITPRIDDSSNTEYSGPLNISGYCQVQIEQSTRQIYFDSSDSLYKQSSNGSPRSEDNNVFPIITYRDESQQTEFDVLDVCSPHSEVLSFEKPLVVESGKLLVPKFSYRNSDAAYIFVTPPNGLFFEVDIVTQGVGYYFFDVNAHDNGEFPIIAGGSSSPASTSGYRRVLIAKSKPSGFLHSDYPFVSNLTAGVVENQTLIGRALSPPPYLSSSSKLVDITDESLNALGITEGVTNDTTRYYVGDYFSGESCRGHRLICRAYFQTDVADDFGEPRCYLHHKFNGNYIMAEGVLEKKISSSLAMYLFEISLPSTDILIRWSVGNENKNTTVCGVQLSIAPAAAWINRNDYPVRADIQSETIKALAENVEYLASGSDKTVVIFGSSNGAGNGASDYTGNPSSQDDWASAPHSWGGILGSSLKTVNDEWRVYNRSISGSNTMTSVSRFWTDVAPHKPSHVILCTALGNENYDYQTYIENTQILIEFCKRIDAVPIVRGSYPKNSMTASEYRKCQALNAQVLLMGVPVINHLNILDSGDGTWLGGTTYAPDGVHLNDQGQQAFFDCIDLGIFLNSGKFSEFNRSSSWMLGSITNDSGVQFDASCGLLGNIKSYSVRLKIKSDGISSVQNLGAFYSQFESSPVLLKCSAGVLLLTDGVGVVSVPYDLSIDVAEHEVVVTYNHMSNAVALYVDGIIVGSIMLAGTAQYVPEFTLAGRRDDDSNPPKHMEFSAFDLWQVPLSASQIWAMFKTDTVPRGSLIYSSVFSSEPCVIAPNSVQNGLLPRISENWKFV